MSESRALVTNRLHSSREDLLDLGLRNPLLNYRLPKARGVEIVDELPVQVFDVLVRRGQTMTFGAFKESEASDGTSQDDAGPELEYPPLAQPDDADDGKPASRHTDRELQTALTSQRLQGRLLKTERDARTYMEEQGVNILFLALGSLRWYESESSDQPRAAPLVLVPVSLERSGVNQRFRLTYTGEDLDANLSLHAKLRQDFGISLPELLDYEELDVEQYFASVESAVISQSRWQVDRSSISLGFFSFSKFLMYRDLDDELWPEENKLSEHPVVSSLLGDTLLEAPQIAEGEHVDEHLEPEEALQVVDADSSQALALLDIKNGCNLVIQGPPGTGKSQTITNVIAEAVGRGQSVLFVSEKMAALEVVKRRLDSIGLGEACLELHSHKIKKTTVLEEISRILELGQPKLAATEDDLQTLREDISSLNAYCEAVNTPIANSGLTPFKAIGELVRQGRGGAEAPRITHERLSEWSDAEYRRSATLIERLQSKVSEIGSPHHNPFYGTGREVLLPTERPQVEARLDQARQAAEALALQAAALADLLGLKAPEYRSEAETLLEAARRVQSAPDLSGMRPDAREWFTRGEEVLRLPEAVRRYKEVRAEYGDTLIPEAWEQDLLEVRESLAAYGDKWWRIASKNYREAARRVEGLCSGEPVKEPEDKLDLVDAVLEAQRLKAEIEQNGTLGSAAFGDRWQAERSGAEELKGAADFLVTLHRAVADDELPEDVIRALERGPDPGALDERIRSLLQRLEQHESTVDLGLREAGFEQPRDASGHNDEAGKSDLADKISWSLDRQRVRFGTWATGLDSLENIISYNRVAQEIREAGLDSALEIVESSEDNGYDPASANLSDALRYSWCEALLKVAFDNRPELATFDRSTHEQTVERFRRLDELLIQHNRTRVAQRHWSQLPTRGDARGQLAVLKREIQKKRRQMPLRRLMREAGNAIQAIKPVFMMSPLSVANFLAPGTLEFDLVVFDEASQVKPVEALGAIARGRQTVVVGDDKQLPPTSFFDSLTGDDGADEDNVTGDLESVLGLFSSRNAPERMLRWHYRSRHESLITVSNHEFYDDRLTVFPSPNRDDDELGLFYRHLPDTKYERGKSQTNPEEAQAVAAAVMKHAHKRPGLSLGVAAFSAAQAQAIQDQVELLRRNDPTKEAFFGAHSFEPFFVKNLENVQGDERDIIFISIGYGKDQNGWMAMSFGPLNREGGERRLNVLITRARRRCEVFANFTADDIDLGRSSALGVRALKTFLRYASDGGLEVPASTGEPDSPFESSVLKALQGQGYRVDSQVGAAGFFIDLAVVDPERPGRYVMGVECDGATYHSARSARDRDRLRQEVLEGLGWRIHRIWSTDWFHWPDRELEKLVSAIEKARLYSVDTPGFDEIPTSEEPGVIRDTVDAHGDDIQQPSSIQTYERATLDPLPYEIHQIPVQRLAGCVEEIVKIESPVHIDEVARRITEAAGATRVGRRIQEAVLKASRAAARRDALTISGDFLWRSQNEDAPVRDRSSLSNSSRKPELIAPEELRAAIDKVVKEAFGMDRSEVPSAVLRLLLGFRRTSEAARQTILSRLDAMVAQGELKEEGSHITR